MVRTLEAIFRHPVRLLILFLVPIVISLVIAYLLPRSYQSSASLWALRRYEIIGATGPESNLQATPAETQVSALSELLRSRTFALTVAKATDLASTLPLSDSVRSNPQLLDDALLLEVSQHVQVITRGYNLYEITYSNRDPRVAQQVVAMVVQQFKLQGRGFSVVEGQRLLQGYESQLTRAKKDANDAAQAEATYLAAHPELTKPGVNPLNDPQYALLDARRLQAQAILQNIQATIATLSQQVSTQSTGEDVFFSVVDAPVLPQLAESRSKLFLIAGGAGAMVALVACMLYVLILVRRDRSFYTLADLQKIATYPVLIQFPRLSPSARDLLLQNTAKN
ncbi:MAG: hypothetical protein IMW89_14285 [Ktedonobacteraceae bacterium]|nr:hypothetical protein [Ktedonobacteraceae bacterium]